MPSRITINWGFIEPLFRAGGLSNREICRQYELHHAHSDSWQPTVTEAAIRCRAKSRNWTRDLASAVQHATREKLIRQPDGPKQSDDEIVEAAALARSGVIRLQRDDLAKLREHEMELERRLCDNEDQIVVGWYEGNASDHKVKIGLLERARIVREISTARHKRILLERLAWGIDDKGGGNNNNGHEVYLFLGGGVENDQG